MSDLEGDPRASVFDRNPDPFGIADAILRVQHSWFGNPEAWVAAVTRLVTDWGKLQLQFMARLSGVASEDHVPAVNYDERFQDPIWTENPHFDALKEQYLLVTRWVEDMLYATPDIDEHTRDKAGFWVRQWLNAVAPTNYFWTNPLAVAKAVSSGGESVLRGMRNFVADLQAGDVRMVDPDAFVVGRDLASTPGQVVFRNELVELIQYAPATARVREVPLVIVAPWINKYYILDLNPAKSLVRHLVGQGFTVFVTSWRNPPAAMRDTRWDDYLTDGALACLRAAREASGAPAVLPVGYCIGGTLLANLMAWLARGEGEPEVAVENWTLFTTLVDFEHPGEVGTFIDETSVKAIEGMLEERGYLDGREMALSFRMLRSNSLIWHYAVHGYLYGEDPPPFDVLFWNTDGTRLPAAMHAFYLRQFYLRNRLVEADALTIAGRPIDLGRIRQPLYAVGTEQDHIAPWKQTFRICARIPAPVRYVLATSGHILGIVNPPVEPPKRRYWVGDAGGASDPDRWLEAQQKVPGSWWDDWTAWLHGRTGDWVPGREPGAGGLPAIGPAPGRYVLEP